MNFLSWALALGLMAALGLEATKFHHATLCRQKNWAMAFNLRTQALFSEAPQTSLAYLPSCKSALKRIYQSVSWQTPGQQSHAFRLDLRGNL